MASGSRAYGLVVAGIAAVAVVALLVFAGKLNDDDRAIENPSIGDGELTVYLYEDYQCPHCLEYSLGPAFQHLKETWVDPGHVTLTWKHVAFVGPHSADAARSSQCVHHYVPTAWLEWDHRIYELQETGAQPSESRLRDEVEAWGGIVMSSYDACMDRTDESKVTLDRNQADMNRAGASGTPALVVDGQALNPKNVQAVDAAIQEALVGS